MSAAAKSRFHFYFSSGFTLLFLPLFWPGFIGVNVPGLFFNVENDWQDHQFVSHQEKLSSGDSKIIVVAMDEDTGKKYGFPLDRKFHAQMLDRLKEYGAKTVVFDAMFFEQRAGDDELAQATRRFGKAIHLYHVDTKQTPLGDVVTIVPPIPGLQKASERLGYPDIERVLDADGHIRRAILFDMRTHDPRDPNEIAASVDAAAFASFTGQSLGKIKERWGETKTYWINFRAPKNWLLHSKRDVEKKGKVANLADLDSPYQRVSYMDVLDGQLTDRQKKALKGSLVLIGSTALGYFDHYPTPFTSQAPGVEYHCNILDNMLHEDFIKPIRRGWLVLVILGMIWLPMLLRELQPITGTAVTAGVALAWWWFCQWMFSRGWRVEFVAPLVALLCVFLTQTVHRVLTEGAEKRFIKNVFGQFVAPEVVDDLVKDPGKVKLGGEKRDLTIFFLDIAHFTNISEKMTPEVLIRFLNYYLTPLSHVIHEQRGVVDKYIGDCIMAFWNAPIELKDHRARACLAAIECQSAMVKLNAELDGNIKPSEPPAIRIGLNSGEATVGLTGSQKKLQYTVIGDEVNLASRLEGANKFFGSRIMASEATYAGAADVVVARELGRVRVVGKETPIKVFELLAKKGELPSEWQKALPRYEKGLELFKKRDYAEAALEFQELIKIFPNDGPGNLYLNASRDYAAIPPDENWDGVFNLTAK